MALSIETSKKVLLDVDIIQPSTTNNLSLEHHTTKYDDKQLSQFYPEDQSGIVLGSILVRLKEGLESATSETILQCLSQASTEPLTFSPVVSAHKLYTVDHGTKNKERKHQFGLDRWVELCIDPEVNILFEVEKYQHHPLIEIAQPKYELEAYRVPNYPYYHSNGSWGQDYQDLYGLHRINVSSAWDHTIGDSDIIVAVVDSGVDYTHPDMADNMWINTDELPDNGIDDDGDGFIDNLHGADFAGDDGDPMDFYGHGTHCAGTIAAVGNNSLGVVGVTWQTQIMAVKFLLDSGGGDVLDAADAIIWAVDQGAHVISNSWGYILRTPSDPILENAIHYAYDAGCVLVFAAGNINDDVQFYCPQNMEETITVAATDYNDIKAPFSCWGEKVDVCAPGVNILSLRAEGIDPYGDGSHIVGDHYLYMNGTSMATPHVAGLAALMLAKNLSLTPDMIKIIMKNTADPVSSPVILGGGRINASEAVRREPALAVVHSPEEWANCTGMIDFQGTAWGQLFTSYILEYGRGRSPESWTELLTSSTEIIDGIVGSLDTSGLDDGIYTIRLQVHCSDGISQDTAWFVVNYEQSTLVVDDNGSADYHFIQQAIYDAGWHDTVLVQEGVYVENLFIDRSIKLLGEHAETTILQATIAAGCMYLMADDITVSGLTVLQNQSKYTGIGVYSDHNVVTGNIIRGTSDGIELESSSHNVVSENLITHNSIGITISGSCVNTTIVNNTISENSKFSSMGIFLVAFFGSSSCYDTVIQGNVIAHNGDVGIVLAAALQGSCEATSIVDNVIHTNVNTGIWMLIAVDGHCDSTFIVNNTIANSYQGIDCDVKASGSTNTNMLLTQNLVSNNDIGIDTETSFPPVSSEAVLTENAVVGNHHLGICLEGGTDNSNTLYHNTFLYNTHNAYDNASSIWDDGYPSGGNYWSDYQGEDSNGDGIGDVPYIVPNGTHQDRYPLMLPWDYGMDSPPVVYIDDDFTQATPRWQYDHFAVVQDGITTVRKNGIVFVYNGTYPEHISISKPLSLLGQRNTSVSFDRVDADAPALQIQDTQLVSCAHLLCDQHASGIMVNASRFVTLTHNHLYDNVPVNCSLLNSSAGIVLAHATSVVLAQNDIQGNTWGIRVIASSNITMKDNIIYNNTNPSLQVATFPTNFGGILLEPTTKGSLIFENTLCSNEYGIAVNSNSTHNRIYHNTFLNNVYSGSDVNEENVWDDGYPSGGNYWDDYAGCDAEEDGIGDSPYLLAGAASFDSCPLMSPWTGVSPVPYGVIFVDDDYTEGTAGWKYNHFNNLQEGIDEVEEHENVSVQPGQYRGPIFIEKPLLLQGKDKDTTIIYGMGPLDISMIGLKINHTYEVSIAGFTLRDYYYNIYLDTCSRIMVTDALITNTIVVPEETDPGVGVVVQESEEIIFRNNRISNKAWGLQLLDNTTLCDIIGNAFTNNTGFQGGNGGGLSLEWTTTENLLYHNNFMNNSINAFDEGSNLWHSGYPKGGNYWDDYEGSDEFSGPGQNISGSDGLGDTPYEIPDQGNIDPYPLMTPWVHLLGDINEDRFVNVVDLLLLLQAWGPNPGHPADLNEDDVVNTEDLLILLGNWSE